ncbi:MAG: HD domain-containing protein [Deltaproteobacteria bacterium]|nr:HD domain-containing protein [Deltaproteobacteria bacterium]
MEKRYPELYALVKPFLETRDNEVHTRVAFEFALVLLAAEGGDPDVVLPAVMLHDIGWKFIPEDLHLQAFGPGANDMEINRMHEVEGSKKAREILEALGYDPQRIREIVEIILGHDSRLEALSLNDSLVKDSDKLWRFSAQALEIDPKRFKIEPAVHAEWLKHQIDKWFFTETAKRLAREEQRQRAFHYGPPPKTVDRWRRQS